MYCVTGFGIEAFPQIPLNVSLAPMPLPSVEEDEAMPGPQSQDSTVRNRKRSAASSAAAIFDSVDTLIGSSSVSGKVFNMKFVISLRYVVLLFVK